MDQHAIKLKEFQENNEVLLSFLSKKGWDVPEDEMEQDLMMSCFQLFQTELPAMRQAVERSSSIVSSTWVHERAAWEDGMMVADRETQRKDLIAIATQKMVDSDYLQDAQRRWEKAEFTSVSKDFLVIGDLYVSRLGGQLESRDEYDPDIVSARAGRKDLTYQTWKNGEFMEKVQRVRPKINGERFVIVREGKSKVLRGFKDILVPENFPATLVEYYAGSYYVLEPILQAGFSSLVEEQGKKFSREFLSHPWLSTKDMLQRKEEFFCHRYDGMMLLVKNQASFEEVRAKWIPTAEVNFQGHVWEITSVRKMSLLKPRPGKMPTSLQSADAVIRSRIQGAYLYPFFSKVEKRTPEVEVISGGQPKEIIGAKILLFVVHDAKIQLALYREKPKGLDALGGHVECGETPVQAAIREGWEESHGMLTIQEKDLSYHGVTVQDNYASHVYTMFLAADWRTIPGLEVYEIHDFAEWAHKHEGYPRQPWLNRHILFMGEKYINLLTAYSAHLMLSESLLVCGPALNPLWTSPLIHLARLTQHEADYAQKYSRIVLAYIASGMTELDANKRVQECWPIPRFSVLSPALAQSGRSLTSIRDIMKADNDVQVQQPLNNVSIGGPKLKAFPEDEKGMKVLIGEVFALVNAEIVCTADFNRALFDLGYEFSWRNTKRYVKRLKDTRVILEVHSPILKGGLGYKKGE
jgi:hypothetical protein